MLRIALSIAMLLAGYFVWLRFSAKTGGVCNQLSFLLGLINLRRLTLRSQLGKEIKVITNDNQPRARTTVLDRDDSAHLWELLNLLVDLFEIRL